jgi:hypothetical protein
MGDELRRLYHGTSAHLEDAILSEGLRPPHGVDPGWITGPFLTDVWRLAMGFALRAACLHEREHPGPATALGSVLIVELPEAEVRASGVIRGEFVAKGGIVEPRWIVGVKRYDARRMVPDHKRPLLAAQARRHVSKRQAAHFAESEALRYVRARRAREAANTASP